MLRLSDTFSCGINFPLLFLDTAKWSERVKLFKSEDRKTFFFTYSTKGRSSSEKEGKGNTGCVNRKVGSEEKEMKGASVKCTKI